jgi:hypothetical protein
MNLKMNLIYLSLLIGMVMFSNQAVNAQKGSAFIFQRDAADNLLKRSFRDTNQGDLCLGLTNQKCYKSRLETRDEESNFITMNRKYYRKEAEINKALPVDLNSSFNYYSFPNDSTNRAEITHFYLNKSKHQQTAAWVLLGAGSTMAIIGMIGATRASAEMVGSLFTLDSQTLTKATANGTTYSFIMLTGLAADLVSIPFFISASKNKKKAASLSFGNQTFYAPPDKSYSQNLVPSLTLRIKL